MGTAAPGGFLEPIWRSAGGPPTNLGSPASKTRIRLRPKYRSPLPSWGRAHPLVQCPGPSHVNKLREVRGRSVPPTFLWLGTSLTLFQHSHRSLLAWWSGRAEASGGEDARQVEQ